MTNYERGTEVDIVIAGGGTAACVLAGRLQRADPNLSILLIEQGRNNYNDPTVTTPALYLAHLAPNSTTALFYKAKASDHLAGREAVVPAGGIFGGGSSINFMMYTRAQGVDFDSWNTEGWSQKDLIPLARKLETFHPEGEGFDMKVHGHDGPINVTRSYTGARAAEDEFLRAASKYYRREIHDLQDFKSNDGFARWYRYVGPDGKRQDAAHRYIHPLLQDGEHKNLYLLLESKVQRVLFDDNKCAVGVEYIKTPDAQPSTSLSAHPEAAATTVKAKKLVIVSSGAMGTPQVLERSGVGNKSVLEKLDIPIVAEVPGVGEAYQDHHLLLYPYKTSLGPEGTLDGVLSGRVDVAEAAKEKNSILSWNSIDVCSKLRPSHDEVKALNPAFQKAWEKDFAKAPERPLMLMGVVSTFLGDPSLVTPGQYATMGCYTAYPYSRGSIHVNTSDAMKPDGYDFDTGFLSDKGDVDLTKQVWAYKKQREIYRRTSMYRGELELGHPKFPEGSKAALVDLEGKDGGLQGEIYDLEYSAEDDKAIEKWIRENLQTTWHSIGTCAMRPKEDGGVVDKDLNVYGVRGLKVVDLSIVPENVASNTNNTALVVGEKAAMIIGKELGISV